MSTPLSSPEADVRRKAIDPDASVWVSANAGSGKTTILTRRVISLLLGGVDPARILCLTYTRAAAAEMQNRVFDELGLWVTLDDAKLAAAIQEIDGNRPDPARLSYARRLFARAVETPGGLKIQTIHAFCERLLHLFPFESNVPARFRLMDEAEQTEVLADCATSLQQMVSAKASSKKTEPGFAQAVACVLQDAGEQGFATLIREALKWREAIEDFAGYNRDSEDERFALAELLGLASEDTEEAITQEIAFGQVEDFWSSTVSAGLQKYNDTDRTLAGDLARIARMTDASARSEACISALLTKGFTPVVNLPTKAVNKGDPALYAMVKTEQGRLVALVQKRFAARCLARTQALMRVADGMMNLYEEAKRQRGLLDFDDVIRRTSRLLLRGSSAWVLYKLDGGIDHLLVDEAQDTSPLQWQILTQLTSEFFTGNSARRTTRTIFAVGDEKQSIYSFQGAAPDAFAVQKKLFRQRIEAIQQKFHSVKLQLSFRTTGDVLSAVDRTFSVEKNYRGLSSDDPVATVHESARVGQAGLVEIWPPEEPVEELEIDPHREVDAVSALAPEIKLASRIARRIAFWQSTGARFDNDGRRIGPGDVMILVRNRGVFFNAMIRALKSANVPVAGADRLKLTDHIAVMDLLAVAEIALLPEDDLMMAMVLKSPLIGLDDHDLTRLCATRGEISLFQALAENPDYSAAHQSILRFGALARSCDPFHFFSTILATDGGRKRMIARLGRDAAEAMDVFLSDALNWQVKNNPSLFGFICFMRSSERQVKREFENTPDAVRVMTVHASKGLEARIVFLGDTFSAPDGKKAPKLFKLADTARFKPEIVAWSLSKTQDPPQVLEARDQWLEKEREEYRRLLYVAMTRAKDRLYLSGYRNKNKAKEDAWFLTVSEALGILDELGDSAKLQNIAAEDGTGEILQWRTVPLKAVAPVDASGAEAAPFSLPGWLNEPLLQERPQPSQLRPSQVKLQVSTVDADRSGGASAAQNLAQNLANNLALRRGTLVHMLLQHLPGAEPDKRSALADRLLTLKAPDITAKKRIAMRDTVLALLCSEAMQHLLGPNSRAEVEISGNIRLSNNNLQPVSARMDRLVVLETEIWIADFKTGRHPANPSDIPDSIVAQLALYRALLREIYPSKTVRAGVVWTEIASFVQASDTALDLAYHAITSG